VFGTFIQLVVDGLASGSIYAAIALAIVLVNRATGLVNFAQGGMAVLAAYVAYSVIKLLGPGVGDVPALIIGIVVSVLFSFAFGAVVERFLMRRFERGDPDTAVVVTIGLLTLITGFAGWVWSYNYLQFPWFFPLSETVRILGTVVSVWSLTTFIAILVIMVLLQLLFQRTKLGLALRAVSDNPRSASLSGLPVGRLLMIGWGLAAALGAVAGALIAPKLELTPNMLDTTLVYALAAVIIGGLDSPLGAVVAAWAIAILENLAGAYLPFVGNDLKVAVPFVLIFVVLILRPQGLFGRKAVVRV
jgi:branched-chain amino acid transport system permease protein